MRAVLVLAVLTSCGRLGFDPIAMGTMGVDGAAGDGDVMPATCDEPELCDALDNDGDGDVDECCPCEPFSLDIPGILGSTALSYGVGWGVERGAEGYAFLDDAGNVTETVLPGLSSRFSKFSIAWNGSRAAYVDTAQSRLVTMRPDGSQQQPGPSVPSSSFAALRWTGSGYDIAVTGISSPMTVVRTDANGNPSSSVTTAEPRVDLVALTHRRGQTLVAWYDSDMTQAAVAVVEPPSPLVPMPITPITFAADAASDEERAVILPIGGDDLVLIDDAGARTLAPTVTNAFSIARIRDRWAVLTFDNSGPDRVVQLVLLHDDLTIASTEPVGLAADVAVHASFVVGDARRLLIGYSYGPDSDTGTTHLEQRCL